jgi:hypothetical protein
MAAATPGMIALTATVEEKALPRSSLSHWTKPFEMVITFERSSERRQSTRTAKPLRSLRHRPRHRRLPFATAIFVQASIRPRRHTWRHT